MEKLYTVKETADILELKPITIRRWIAAGKIKVNRLPGGGIRILESEIARIAGIEQ